MLLAPVFGLAHNLSIIYSLHMTAIVVFTHYIHRILILRFSLVVCLIYGCSNLMVPLRDKLSLSLLESPKINCACQVSRNFPNLGGIPERSDFVNH